MAATGSRRIRGLVGIAVVAVLAAVATGFAVEMALGGSSDSSDATTAAPTSADVSDEASQFSAAQQQQRQEQQEQQQPLDANWKLSKRVEHAVPTGDAVGSAGGSVREVALSFDDGPSIYTSQVLDILDRRGVKATFFVVGRNAVENPHLIRRAVESGNEIGNHTWSHTALTALKKLTARRQEVEGANDVVRAATGHKPLLFRPPYGAMRPGTNREVRRLGMLPVVWSVDVKDYDPRVTSKALVRRVRQALRPGSIILLHDGGGDRRKTVAALPAILAEVVKAGYRPVTITQLLNDAPPQQDDLAGRM
jgi:peptidoglycan/xylan/chitin deacetylase (PgdA/CDA1 family)